MRLNEIQRSFTYSLLANKEGAGSVSVISVLKDGDGVSVENRLKVYRNNVVQNLSNAVMSALPMTRTLVGEDFLKKSVRAYIFAHLPEEGNLNSYGCTFPDFIKTYAPAADIPYICDFTRLEWAWEHAYYAQDDEGLDVAELAGLDEAELPELQLLFRPSVSLLQSEYPLDQIMDECRHERDISSLMLEDRGVYMLVYRPALQVDMWCIPRGEFYFLESLYGGKTIEHASITAIEQDSTFDLAPVLQKYLSARLFAGYKAR